MFGSIYKYFKRELFYAVALFVILQFSLIPKYFDMSFVSNILLGLGALILLLWLISSYLIFSGKRVSKFSNVLIKIQIKNRLFSFFVTPVLMYFAVSAYISYIENNFLKQVIITIFFVLMLFLMIHIRSSYQKVFSIEKSTRSVFLFIDMMLFYIASTGFILMGTFPIARILGVGFLAFLFLLNILIINKQYSYKALFILLISTIFMILSAIYFVQFGALLFPLFMVVVFYMVVNIWGIKLSGVNALSEYLPPVLFSLMAFMILLSF